MKRNGRIDNYTGDGLMAVFESDAPTDAAQNVVRAGLEMLAVVEGMQLYLAQNYGHNLRIGIGIHCGVVVDNQETIDELTSNRNIFES
jgi:adenylate cyclase